MFLSFQCFSLFESFCFTLTLLLLILLHWIIKKVLLFLLGTNSRLLTFIQRIELYFEVLEIGEEFFDFNHEIVLRFWKDSFKFFIFNNFLLLILPLLIILLTLGPLLILILFLLLQHFLSRESGCIDKSKLFLSECLSLLFLNLKQISLPSPLGLLSPPWPALLPEPPSLLLLLLLISILDNSKKILSPQEHAPVDSFSGHPLRPLG